MVAAPSTSARATEALLRADREFAAASIARGTPAAFADYSAETVINLPANGPPTSTKAALLARLSTLGSFVLTWEPQRAEVTNSGEMGFTWGEWALRQGVNGPVQTRGKYLNVWRRQADGAWKAVVDIANTSTVGTAPTSAAPLAFPNASSVSDAPARPASAKPVASAKRRSARQRSRPDAG